MSEKIAIIGLGYVGLPLAVHLAKHFPVLGFDISQRRVDELARSHDRTDEVDDALLKSSSLKVSADVELLKGQDIYIVTVPTPVDSRNEPDLTPVLSACASVGKYLGKGAIVVFESTVYPGVTEKIAGPALERASGLVCGRDFFLGYSPERINPGDREHTVDRIVKIVAGQTPEVTARLVKVYGALNGGKIYAASSIMAAEAAKVIENAQRDINIAFVNEISTIFRKLGLSTHDVLEAAGTKWNFLPFTPGLVGGHCIGVDPFYLARCAKDLGYNPEIILSGRRINDGMAEQIASELHALLLERLPAGKAGRVMVLGLTFKENVPDLRNSKVADLISALTRRGHLVSVADPLADSEEAYHEYGLRLESAPEQGGPYDLIIAAVGHKAYTALTPTALTSWLTPKGIVADLKGLWRGQTWPENIAIWQV
jgi:UDP-N-acetyl-D-glucosamine/UDP-N-acetyl-D-galactosamine dehydrogenase